MNFTAYKSKLCHLWDNWPFTARSIRKLAQNRKVQFMVLSLGLLLLPGSTSADVGTALQAGYNFLTSKIARGLAVLAIAGVGFSCFQGKMAWKWGVLICLGIGIIFSARDIADLLGAGG